MVPSAAEQQSSQLSKLEEPSLAMKSGLVFIELPSEWMML
jgi:hypothetical protein